MTLVILAVFVVMALATTSLISRQFNEIARQEQEEQAFQIAEAGVHYAVWLLDNDLIDYTSPQGISDYAVTDQTKEPPEVLGTFDLEFTVLQHEAKGPAAVKVKATGEDLVLINRRQVIEAVIQSDDLDTFRVVEWDHTP